MSRWGRVYAWGICSMRETYRVVNIHFVTGFGLPLADLGPVFHADLQLSHVLFHGCSEHTPQEEGAAEEQHVRLHDVLSLLV